MTDEIYKVNLLQEVARYFELRGLHVGTTTECMGWITTELGEVWDCYLSRPGSLFTRNNPDKHPETNYEKLAEELGDVIMMCVVTGFTIGQDPIRSLLNKMQRKIGELKTDGDV